MRILFVSGLTGFGLGGAQTEFIRLVQGIRKRDVVPGCAIDRLPSELARCSALCAGISAGGECGAAGERGDSQFKPDCVHLVGGGIGFLRAVDCLNLSVPWVFTAHNLPPFERIFSTCVWE